MKNWKTSLSGWIAAAAGFVAFSPELFVHYVWLVAISKYVMVGGLAGMGIFARDSGASEQAHDQDNMRMTAIDSQLQSVARKQDVMITPGEQK